MFVCRCASLLVGGWSLLSFVLFEIACCCCLDIVACGCVVFVVCGVLLVVCCLLYVFVACRVFLLFVVVRRLSLFDACWLLVAGYLWFEVCCLLLLVAFDLLRVVCWLLCVFCCV